MNGQSAWDLNLNDAASATIKFGTSSADPINFYTNTHRVMSLGINGKLKLDSLAGSSYGLLYTDQYGTVGRMPSFVPGSPCYPGALPWSLGGNQYPTDNTIGTCTNEDFILKSGDVPSVFVTANAYVGIGKGNTSPQAALDVSQDDNNGNQVAHIKIYGDMSGTIESTSSFNLNYPANGGFWINQGGGGKFSIYNGLTTIATDLKASGKINMGSQTNATNSAKLNINMNSSNTGSSADNAFDVYDQSSQKINFRVKASGYVYAKEINVQLTAFPDYVFDKAYRLQSLESLERFIKQNKHLPGVPTAKEIASDGANLAELSKIQMEKIEELTLYVIELKKEVDELKKQVNK